MFISKLKHLIVDYFSIPTLKNDDIYEESKYILTCKLFSYISVAMLLIFIINIIHFTPTKFIPTGIAGIACFISYRYIKKTGKYYSTSIISSVFCAILLTISVYANPKNPHIVEGLWMINSSLFVYLTLGKRYGFAFTIFHALNLVIYYTINTNSQMAFIYQNPLDNEDVLGICVSIFVAFLTFSYFNWLMISTNIVAAKKIEVSSNILKEQFDTISKQNEEKTVMLKEIHHRVKNNLQLIISLLRLQSRELTNNETITQFDDAINRILTISLVHEKMYQTDDLSQLDLKGYFSNLGNDIIRSHIDSHQIELHLNIQVDKIRLKPIVPIALIFNELISNSLKHGKVRGETLEIYFEMKKNEVGELIFIYSDNGTWKENSKLNTFGLELIEALTQQIEGIMTINMDPKTEFHFRFKKQSAKSLEK